MFSSTDKVTSPVIKIVKKLMGWVFLHWLWPARVRVLCLVFFGSRKQ